MGLLSEVGVLAGTCLTGLVVAIGAGEFSASAPSWAKRIVQRAARALPETERIASEAEWLAHLNDVPGNVGKILHALGLWRAAIITRSRVEVPLEKAQAPVQLQRRPIHIIDWPEISAAIRFGRAKGRCEVCGRPHGRTVWHLGDGRWWDEDSATWRNGQGRQLRDLLLSDSTLERSRSTQVVLVTCHLDHDPQNNAPGNLAALCQRCHLLHDAPVLRRRAVTVLARRAVGDLFTGPYDE